MVTYDIGKSYPYRDYRPGREEIRAVTDHSFFHITYYCLHPKEDSHNWQSGPMVYGLFTHQDILCFVVHLTDIGLSFEVTINVHTIADDLIGDWLNSDRTLVPMLLMDANTNIIQAIRMLFIDPSLSAQLRNCLKKQYTHYANVDAVEKATDELLSRIDMEQLLKQTPMYRS